MAEARIIKATCLPWHRRTESAISADLQAMQQHGLIELYEMDGTSYGWFPNWRKHQPSQKSDRLVASEIPPAPGDRLESVRSQTGGSSEPVRPLEEEDEVKEEVKGTTRDSWPAERALLKDIPGYPFSERKDRQLLDTLAGTYGQLDLAKELQKLKAWLIAKNMLPLKGQSGPRQRIRRWMQKADEFSGGADAARPRIVPATETGDLQSAESLRRSRERVEARQALRRVAAAAQGMPK